MFALKWEDIHWEIQQIHIQCNLQRVLRDGKQVRDISTPKTVTSNRSIIVGEKTLDVLKLQQKEVEKKKALAKKRWQENDLVFSSSTGTPLNQSNVLKQYAEIQKAANLKHIRFHDLHHAAISTLNNDLGAPVKVAQQVAGHTRVSTTLDIYTDEVDAVMLRDYAERSEKLLFGE